MLPPLLSRPKVREKSFIWPYAQRCPGTLCFHRLEWCYRRVAFLSQCQSCRWKGRSSYAGQGSTCLSSSAWREPQDIYSFERQLLFLAYLAVYMIGLFSLMICRLSKIKATSYFCLIIKGNIADMLLDLLGFWSWKIEVRSIFYEKLFHVFSEVISSQIVSLNRVR